LDEALEDLSPEAHARHHKRLGGELDSEDPDALGVEAYH
jgi:hypothetical protein